MKKKIITSMLLSALVLTQGASLVNVHADTTDDKIAAQNNKINSLNAQQQAEPLSQQLHSGFAPMTRN